MATKFYAVKQGRTPGIYNTWADCQKQVTGFSGAIYKSFPTAQQAAEYMGWANNSNTNIEETKKTNPDVISKNMPLEATTSTTCNASPLDVSPLDASPLDASPLDASTATHAIAYVDGSFNVNNGMYGYGVVFFHNKSEDHYCGNGSEPDMTSMRNVAGEILGARTAMEEALKRGCTSLTIYHDYEGISRWCLGEWKTNKKGTIEYKAYFDSICSQLKVSFVKVKGHSNDKYNDLADELAKKTIF